MHGLTGRKQSPEHLAKRVTASLRTKAAWSDERRAEYSRAQTQVMLARETPVYGPRDKVAGSKNPNWRGGEERACAVCGGAAWAKPSQLKRGQAQFHCSKVCANQSAKTATAGVLSGRWAGGSEQRQCQVCEGEFTATRREITRGRASFCSLRCAGLAKRKERTEREIAGLRLHCRVTRLMHRNIRRGTKNGRTWPSLVGYTVADLMAHLERQFVAGMSWENMGAWHIDHVRPRVSFSFASPDDPAFRDCWALSNLQPLWAVDNLKKGARFRAA